MSTQQRKSGKSQRRLVNLMLQPVVQLRFGAVNLSLTFVFLLLLGYYMVVKLRSFTEVVVALTEADQHVFQLLNDYLVSIGLTAAAGSVVFIIVNLFLSVWLSHKLVGPTIAFRRHIKTLIAGDFSARTRLRRGDAFVEVADDLNKLSEVLSEKVRF